MNHAPKGVDLKGRQGGDMDGRLLTDPVNYRGLLRVSPIRGSDGPVKALRVEVFSATGTRIVDFRATEIEVTIVEAPNPDGSATIKRYPGSFWFSDEKGQEVGFLADSNAGALALPMAVEKPRKPRPSPENGGA